MTEYGVQSKLISLQILVQVLELNDAFSPVHENYSKSVKFSKMSI